MPVTSLHLFSGPAHFRMLQAFGMLHFQLGKKQPGVLFAKAMGCGKGIAFSLLPDWGRYAVMLECESEEAEQMLTSGKAFQRLIRESLEHRRIGLIPFQKHGSWSGQNPFAIEASEKSGAVAVLTRARIATRSIPTFIRKSNAATQSLKMAPGLRFSIGMGEAPLWLQATFSIWEDDAAMLAWAYSDKSHLAAMNAKRERDMFAEEMFVRFRLQKSDAAGKL